MKIITHAKTALVLFSILFYSLAFADTTANTTNGTSLPSNNTATVNPVASDDASITSNVQAKIAQDTSLAGSNISVYSRLGVVTLSGTATSQAQADAAVSEAKSVMGVKDVSSTIIVNNTDNAGTSTSTSSY